MSTGCLQESFYKKALRKEIVFSPLEVELGSSFSRRTTGTVAWQFDHRKSRETASGQSGERLPVSMRLLADLLSAAQQKT